MLRLRAEPLRLGDGVDLPQGAMFRTSGGLELVLDFHDRLEARGAYLLIVEHGRPEATFTSDQGPGSVHQLPAELDLVGLLPTTDKFDAVKLMGTDGNGQHNNPEIVAWLRELDRMQPFLLVGAGYDFVEGVFPDPVRDPASLAHRIYAFCPDFWAAGPAFFEPGSPEPHIAEHLAHERTFYCWWD